MVDIEELYNILAGGDLYHFKNQFGRVFLSTAYNIKLKCLISSWMGFVTPQDIKESSEAKLALMARLTITAIINDNKHLEGPWYDANDWIQQEWLPRAKMIGLKRIAQILSLDKYAALSAQEMLAAISNTDLGVEVGVFTTLEEAKDWIGTMHMK